MGERSGIRVRVGGFITHDNRLLLIEQRRRAEASQGSYWLLPGGGVKSGEPLAEALRREIAEELAVSAEVGRPIALVESISPDPAYDKHVLHVIMAAALREPPAAGRITPADQALLSARFVSAAELQALNLRPPIAAHLARYVQRLPVDVEYLGSVW